MFPKPIFSYTKLTYLSNLFHFLLARWSKKQFCDILKHICLKPPTNQILHFCCCCCFIYCGRYQLWKMEIIKWCKNKTLSERGGHRGQKWQINCKSNNNFLQIIKKCWLNTNSKNILPLVKISFWCSMVFWSLHQIWNKWPLCRGGGKERRSSAGVEATLW